MVSTSHSQPPNSRSVIIDTCIIQYLSKKNNSLATIVNDCLTSLKENSYNLIISEISFYENLHGLWGSNASKADELLRTYQYKEVTREVLLIASMLGGLYHDEKYDGIEMGDKIIAATAVLEDGFVLTANHKDFPHPFFTTKQSFALSYKVGHTIKTLDIALYEPNLDIISRRVNEKKNMR